MTQKQKDYQSNGRKFIKLRFYDCPKCEIRCMAGDAALSRELKDTYVCSKCGLKEALADAKALKLTGIRKYSY